MKIYSVNLYNSTTFKQKNAPQYEKESIVKDSNNHLTRNIILTTTGVLCVGTTAYFLLRKGKLPEIKQPRLKQPDNIKLITTTTEFSSEKLDEISSKNGAFKPDSWSFEDIRKYYSELEEKEEQIVNQIKKAKKAKQKKEFSPEKLDEYIAGTQKENTWSSKDMQEYYQNGCVTEKTLPNGSKVVEYPRSLDGRQTIITTTPEGLKTTRKTDKYGHYMEYTTTPNGHTLESTLYSGNGRFIKNIYDENGKLSKIINIERDRTSTTTLHGHIKTIYTTIGDGKYTRYKIYEQDKTGKYRCIKRESYDNTDNIRKTVEYIEDGKYSKTTVSSPYETTVTIRDKKGNIVDLSKIDKSSPANPPEPPANTTKILAPWYKDYLELCKKYGATPRACGMKGGAWDHYYELCLLRDDPEAYAKYLKLQEYRARYDSKAQLMEILRYGEKRGISPEILDGLTEDKISELYQYLSEGHINLEDLKNMSKDEIRAILKQIKTKIVEIEKQQELERQRQLLEQQERQQQPLILLA